MDAAEPIETKQDGLSININSPCNNRIAYRDFIEVNIHFGNSDEDSETGSADESELQKASGDAVAGAVETAVPKAIQIARRIRKVGASGL